MTPPGDGNNCSQRPSSPLPSPQRQQPEREALEARIDVVPYIDVMLVLFIFDGHRALLISVTDIDPPKCGRNTLETPKTDRRQHLRRRSLRLDARSRQEPQPEREGSVAELGAYRRENRTRPCCVERARDARHQTIMAGIDLIEDAGIGKVSLVEPARGRSLMRGTGADTTYAIAFALLLHAMLLASPGGGLVAGQESAIGGRTDPRRCGRTSTPCRPACAVRCSARPNRSAEAIERRRTASSTRAPDALEEPSSKKRRRAAIAAAGAGARSRQTQQEEVAPMRRPTPPPRRTEAKRMQGQRDLTENRETQEEIEQRRLSEMERQRQQQLADTRRRARRSRTSGGVRRKNVCGNWPIAARSRRPDAAAGAPPAGDRGSETDPNAAYAKAIADAIRRNWVRPDNVLPSQRCRIVIRRLPAAR